MINVFYVKDNYNLTHTVMHQSVSSYNVLCSYLCEHVTLIKNSHCSCRDVDLTESLNILHIFQDFSQLRSERKQ